MFPRVFHTIVAILLFFIGIGIVAVGIWLAVKKDDNLYTLNYDNADEVLDAFSKAYIAAFSIGGFMILTALFSLIALSRSLVGITFRTLYIICALIIIIVLILSTIVGSVVVNEVRNGGVRREAEYAWKRTASDDPRIICKIQCRYNCYGFSTGECSGIIQNQNELQRCNEYSRCPPCTENSVSENSRGCYGIIEDQSRTAGWLVAVFSAVLAVLLFVDIFLTCCLGRKKKVRSEMNNTVG